MADLQQETNPVNNHAANTGQEFDMSRLDGGPDIYKELAAYGKREHIDSPRIDQDLRAELKATFVAQMNADLDSPGLAGFNSTAIKNILGTETSRIPNNLSSADFKAISKLYQREINEACKNGLVNAEVVIDGYIGRETLAARVKLSFTLGDMSSLQDEIEKDLKTAGKGPNAALTVEQENDIKSLTKQAADIGTEQVKLQEVIANAEANIELLSSENRQEYLKTADVSMLGNTKMFNDLVSKIGEERLLKELPIDNLKELQADWSEGNIERLTELQKSISSPLLLNRYSNKTPKKLDSLKNLIAKKIEKINEFRAIDGERLDSLTKSYSAAERFQLNEAKERLAFSATQKKDLGKEIIEIQNNGKGAAPAGEMKAFNALVQEEKTNRIEAAKSVVAQEQKNLAQAELNQNLSKLQQPTSLEEDLARSLRVPAQQVYVDPRFRNPNQVRVISNSNNNNAPIRTTKVSNRPSRQSGHGSQRPQTRAEREGYLNIDNSREYSLEELRDIRDKAHAEADIKRGNSSRAKWTAKEIENLARVEDAIEKLERAEEARENARFRGKLENAERTLDKVDDVVDKAGRLKRRLDRFF